VPHKALYVTIKLEKNQLSSRNSWLIYLS